MERRNPADDRLDSLKSTRGLLSLLKRKRDDEEEDLGPREGESGEDYKARLMESMREAMESCSEALRIRDERVVLASKFGDANPRYRDLLLATGDKPIYLQLCKTKKDDLIWEFGAREKDVTTSGLGLYGDLLMAQREALRA